MSRIVPPPAAVRALFLDVDGTLVDIAPTPQQIEVSADLPPLLGRLSRRCGGSLALVSGRCIADLDRLFHPLRFPAAGIHGSERRDALGNLHFTGLTSADLEPARAELRRFAARHPAVLLEDKGRGLALHFRQAPELETAVREMLEHVRVHLPADTHLQHGHCVIEIKGGSSSKREAVAQFMQEPPFAGRVPIYVGDDLTDLDALAYVQSAGGQGIFVGPESKPGHDWLPNPAAVRDWLRSLENA
jgi:trehalose 6-phosphate phosphatase